MLTRPRDFPTRCTCHFVIDLWSKLTLGRPTWHSRHKSHSMNSSCHITRYVTKIGAITREIRVALRRTTLMIKYGDIHCLSRTSVVVRTATTSADLGRVESIRMTVDVKLPGMFRGRDSSSLASELVPPRWNGEEEKDEDQRRRDPLQILSAIASTGYSLVGRPEIPFRWYGLHSDKSDHGTPTISWSCWLRRFLISLLCPLLLCMRKPGGRSHLLCLLIARDTWFGAVSELWDN